MRLPAAPPGWCSSGFSPSGLPPARRPRHALSSATRWRGSSPFGISDDTRVRGSREVVRQNARARLGGGPGGRWMYDGVADPREPTRGALGGSFHQDRRRAPPWSPRGRRWGVLPSRHPTLKAALRDLVLRRLGEEEGVERGLRQPPARAPRVLRRGHLPGLHVV